MNYYELKKMKFLGIIPYFCLWVNLNAQNNIKNPVLEYRNANTLAIKTDDVITKDKFFRIKIPYAIQSSKVSVSNQFFHLLKMRGNKQIWILYCPNKNLGANQNVYQCPFKEFEDFLISVEMENVLNGLSICKHRKFGIKIIKKSYIIAYMNVTSQEASLFDYSLDTFDE